MGPYIASRVFPYSAVEIQDLDNDATSKVNGQRFKQSLELPSTKDVEGLILCKPSSYE